MHDHQFAEFLNNLSNDSNVKIFSQGMTPHMLGKLFDEMFFG
jgi:hypothetical protein